MDCAIRFAGVSTATALRDVTLDVRRGDIVGVVGARGAGKSTLLRLVNGLETPERGAVFVKGRDLAGLTRHGLRAARQQIGMVFQQAHLLNNLTVADNVALPLHLHGRLNAPRLQKRVRDCLDMLDLAPLADAWPARLDAGQRQRTAIARALASQPDILLCDDPTAALDTPSSRLVLGALHALHATTGVTLIIASHDLRALGALCRRAVVLQDGGVAEQFDVRDPAPAPRRTALGRELACHAVEMRALLGQGTLHA